MHYFLFDPLKNDANGRTDAAYVPIGLNGRLPIPGTIADIRLAAITGLDDEGRIFGVIATPKEPLCSHGQPDARSGRFAR